MKIPFTLTLSFLLLLLSWDGLEAHKGMLIPADEDLLQVIRDISERYDVHFTYDREIVENVEVNEYNPDHFTNVDDALSSVLAGTNLKYVVLEMKYVIIYQDDAAGMKSLEQMVEVLEKIIQQKTKRQLVASLDRLESSSHLNRIHLERHRMVLNVTGTVTDQAGEPLIGVNVVVKGTNKGTSTDFKGHFVLEDVNENATLVFSYVGYKTEEFVLNGRSNFLITMEEDLQTLDEVVVVGYGTQSRSDLTGAISSVSDEDLTLGGTVQSIGAAIQGKVAGVVVTRTSKAPGSGGNISIRVRGSNSINSSNEPLYVIDGFPTDRAAINPNDIQSIDILKGPSATAIYGARGANGVIVITTKRAANGQKQISYNGYVGFQRVMNPFEMLTGRQYMQLRNAQFREIPGQENVQYGVYTQEELKSNVSTNWIEEATRPGIVEKHNIQFLGGGSNTKVFSSLGYFDQQGVLKNTKYSRISGRVNVDQKINSFINIGTSLFAQRSNSNFQLYSGNILDVNVINDILRYSPVVPAYNDDGTFGHPVGSPQSDNPLANLLDRQNDNVSERFNGNVFIEIKPIEGLALKATGGVDLGHGFQGQYVPRSLYAGRVANGIANRENSTYMHQLFQVYTTYKNSFNEKHDYTLMGGYSYEKNRSESSNFEIQNFSTDLFSYNNIGAGSIITDYGSGKTENLLISYFGRVNYSYLDKYLVTLTVRSDGSSRFGKDNRWGIFPSGSFAWRLGQEEIFKDMNMFSNLKLRLGYGRTGNDRMGDYASLALMEIRGYTFNGEDNSIGTVLSPFSPANSGLRWEVTTQYNIGLDIGFVQSRLLITADAYFKRTNDLLLAKTFPRFSGYVSGQANLGSIENKGLDFQIDSHNTVGTFKWNTIANFSINHNKVTELGTQEDIYLKTSKPIGTVSRERYALIREGESLGSLFGYVYDGVIQQGETYAPQPNSQPGDPKFRDISGPDGVPDGRISPDDATIIGHAYPNFIFGLTNTFTYKHFDLNIFMQGTAGNDLLNMNRINLEWQYTTAALDRWTPQNTDTDIPRNGFYFSQYGGYVNSHFIEDASYLRLKQITLGYTAPLGLKILRSFRIYASVENLFTITNYSGWDPEVDTKRYDSGGETANAGAGMDFNSYPNMRTISFGINIKF